ncbi:MAG: dihydrolipoyl dehydrogenase [Pseudobacteriovorax sp.]|nr:dihydrolipoyl dehydrogenase [Pseudobacteriovorax sp.]
MTDTYDVAVIGGGPAGYVAAIRSAQLGMKTAVIESRGTLGGTCLNVGCIPSKALLQSSEVFHQAKHKVEGLGITYENLSFDIKKIHAHKDKVVKELVDGVAYLMKKNKIKYFNGLGTLLGSQKIAIKGEDNAEISAKHIVIATGSAPIEIPTAKFDHKDVVDSTGALNFAKVPKHLVVIGGGVIGLELGSVWARLGAKVSVIEAADTILPMMDKDVIRTMKKTLGKEGLEFHEKTMFKSLEKKPRSIKVVCEKAGETIELSCDKMLVAVGRRAYTDGLGLENVGLVAEKNGKIKVDHKFQTAVPGIYAVGDVIDGPMLAHKAEEEGVACMELIAGKAGHVNYNAVPNVVYTWPEVASVGLTEQECKSNGMEVNIGKFPFTANGRAKCMAETDGFVKIIADKRTDSIVGAHIVGPSASELIGELAVGVEFSASAEDIARSVHAHPTLAEVVKEAALGVDKRSLHS